jgi:biopolymer transport protein ExbB
MMASVDTVIWAVALVLLVMSIWSWTVILNKSLQLRGLRQRGRSTTNAFWQAASLPDAIGALSSRDKSGHFLALARAAHSLNAPDNTGHSAGSHNPSVALPAEDQITRALRSALFDARTSLESGLTSLASIGSVAPFVGLFGTVWSIFNALVAIDGQGPVMIDQVAGPVGEALVITAAGLFVAIPAVMAYNTLARSARLVLAELDGFAHDLRASVLKQADSDTA